MTKTEILRQIINEREGARLVKNKYRVIMGVIKRLYPEYELISKEKWENIVYDIISLDRTWRLYTEDYDKENKKRLSEEFVVNNLL